MVFVLHIYNFLRHSLCLLFLYFFLFATQTSAQQPAFTADSITVAVAPAYDSVSSFHRFWLGEGYRKLWAAPVKMRVLHLSNEKGGLTIEKLGGGLQTKSLRLKDPGGREYVLRTVQKYPDRKLPEYLKHTIAENILQDQVVTAHPYAALTVPPFADALGIPHANPEIVYLADDTALGTYRSEFANAVYLFEEREPSDTSKTVNTESVQEKVEADNDFMIDQELVLRARLLDLLLGNWDRHEDQWRWEKRKQGSKTMYAPVPRDMDAVYYHTTGVLPWIVSHQWLQSRFQGLHENIRDINGFNFINQSFDRYFLIRPDEKVWKEQIDLFERTITDSVIRSALQLLPDTIFALSGNSIGETLIKRRNNLPREALKYYRFLSKTIDVPGTNKREAFSIHYTDTGSLTVTVTNIKHDGTMGKVLFQRELDPGVTKEIRLYGLGGNDVFSITGAGQNHIKVRMIGGEGRDSFAISTMIRNKKNLVIYDRSDQLNVLPQRGATIRTSVDSSVNSFQTHTFKYDQAGPEFLALYDLDQGVQLKAGLMQVKHGFRKEPYALKQTLDAYYSSGRQSFMFAYSADVKRVWGKADLVADIMARGPHNLSNLFGIGNETTYDKKGKGVDYYRNRYDYINGDVRLKWRLPHNFFLSTGPAAQYYTSDSSNNTNRYLNEYNQANPDENVFSNRFYAGLVAGVQHNTRNDALLPGKGLVWDAEIRVMKQLNGSEKPSFGQLYSHFLFYIRLFGNSKYVVANRIGAGTSFGDPLFFQKMQLGGTHNLRGFRTNRFTGKTMLYHNAELRFSLFDFNSYLFPGRLGVVAFNDLGRVWVPGENSNKWHDGYGGGLFIIPAELVLIQVIIGHSKEGTYPYLSLGVSF